MPVWPLASTVLPVGFAVAEATGVRAAGGGVMAALGVAVLVRSRPGVGSAAAWCGVTLAAFAGSHALADVAGAWGAVAIAAAVVGASGWALLDRRATSSRGGRGRTAAGTASS